MSFKLQVLRRVTRVKTSSILPAAYVFPKAGFPTLTPFPELCSHHKQACTNRTDGTHLCSDPPRPVPFLVVLSDPKLRLSVLVVPGSRGKEKSERNLRTSRESSSSRIRTKLQAQKFKNTFDFWSGIRYLTTEKSEC